MPKYSNSNAINGSTLSIAKSLKAENSKKMERVEPLKRTHLSLLLLTGLSCQGKLLEYFFSDGSHLGKLLEAS